MAFPPFAPLDLYLASSFSKNFGLYKERIGALTLVGTDADQTAKALSHLKIAVRTNYSNPPAHGAAIVNEVLADRELRQQWQQELSQMRERINGMRSRFVEIMQTKKTARDFSFIQQQLGMFSFSRLTPRQVDVLREDHSIYVVRSGRINVAGITERNIDRLCEAIAGVL